MKKGKVIILHLYHKNGSTILNAGDKVTEQDVDNFDALVRGCKIEPDEATLKLYSKKEQELIEDKEAKAKLSIEKTAIAKKANVANAELLESEKLKVTGLEKDLEAEKKKAATAEGVAQANLKSFESEKLKVTGLEKDLEAAKKDLAKATKKAD